MLKDGDKLPRGQLRYQSWEIQEPFLTFLNTEGPTHAGQYELLRPKNAPLPPSSDLGRLLTCMYGMFDRMGWDWVGGRGCWG